MGRKFKYHAHFTSRAARNIDWYFKKGMKHQSLINILRWKLHLNRTEWQKSKKRRIYTKNSCFDFFFLVCFSMFWTSVHCCCFFRLVTPLNMVRVIEGRIIYKWSEGKQKVLRVTEGKITVNVWKKSRANRFCFELARVNCIKKGINNFCFFS